MRLCVCVRIHIGMRAVRISMCIKWGQMAERLGNRAINQKVAGSILAVLIEVVSLGKALHPSCLRECPCTYHKS